MNARGLEMERSACKDRAEADVNVTEAIAQRRSCRSYRGDPVPRETLEALIDAARQAPSACNRQPWRFVVATDPDLRLRVVELGFLPGLTMRWALEAPVLIVMGMQRDLVTHRLAAGLARVNYPWMDLGIAGEHIALVAAERGLGTCWIGWIRRAGLRKAVGWPRSIEPGAVMTVGFPAEGAGDVPRTARREMSEIASWR